MGRLELAKRILDYDQQVFDAFARRVRRLGWAVATRDQGLAHGSFKDTLVHILNVQEAWLIAAPTGDWSGFDDPTRRAGNVRAWSGFDAYQARVRAGVGNLSENLTERGLGRRVKVPWMSGRYTLEDGILQATFEEAHHIGEVVSALWRIGQVPPQMMWVPTRLGTKVSVR